MRITLALAALLMLAGCSNNRSHPDVSDVPVDITLERFEQSFFSVDTNRIGPGLAQVANRFPQFYPFFMQQVLRMQPTTPELRMVIASYRPIYDTLKEKYSNLGWLQKELKEGFQYVKHYYPQYKVPKLITFIATFDAPGVVYTPQYIGIGLHQYAGKRFSVYKEAQLQEMYPEYISRRFDREYITPNVLKAVVDDIYPDTSAGRALIDQMIEKGKQWYLLDQFMPEAPDSVKTGYTGRQLEWVKQNEGNIWGYISSNIDIYTIDPALIQDYIGEGPFTRGLPEGYAPGNIGPWVGWQMIRKYAEKNKELTPQQVLATPSRTIFQESKYKPK